MAITVMGKKLAVKTKGRDGPILTGFLLISGAAAFDPIAWDLLLVYVLFFMVFSE